MSHVPQEVALFRSSEGHEKVNSPILLYVYFMILKIQLRSSSAYSAVTQITFYMLLVYLRSIYFCKSVECAQ